MTKNFVYFLITLMISSMVITLLFGDMLSILCQIGVMSVFVIKMKKIMSLSFKELQSKAEQKLKEAKKKIEDTVK